LSGRLHGWVRPGPEPPGGVDVEAGETLDYLAGRWRIFQYEKGHRYSVDDALTAHYATTCAPRVERYLDLGSGIGSVALFVAWRCPAARVTTVEAQDRSRRLAEKSARYNGVEDRFTILAGDLREDDVLAGRDDFDLITGTPPYWPLGTHREAAHPQAVPARLEVRGDIADYARAAAGRLAPGGVFVCCFPTDQRARVLEAHASAGLVVVRTRAVRFKEGRDYGFTLFCAQRAGDLPDLGPPLDEPELVLRTAAGAFSAEYARVRLTYGFPPGELGLREEAGEAREHGDGVP
jgi:tRNA1(Val) A37 N6-methylase TrmN6